MPAAKLYSDQDLEILRRKGVLKHQVERRTTQNGWFMDPVWDGRIVTEYLVNHLRSTADVETDDAFDQQAQSVYDVIKGVLDLSELPPQPEEPLRLGREILHKFISSQLTISATGAVQRSLNGDRPPRWLIRKKQFRTVDNVSVYAVTANPDLIERYDRVPGMEKAARALARQQDAQRLLVRRVPELAAFEIARSYVEAQRALFATQAIRAELTRGYTPEQQQEFDQEVAEIQQRLDPTQPADQSS